MDILLLVLVALAVITVVGHLLWLALAAVSRFLMEDRPDEKVPPSREQLAEEKLRDLEITTRTIRGLLASGELDQASVADLEKALDKVEINYRVQDAGIRNKAILRYAVREKLGAIIGFHELTPGAGRHMVTLVDYGPEEVRVLDSNDSDGRIRTMPRKRFLSWWDGFVLVIEPDEAE